MIQGIGITFLHPELAWLLPAALLALIVWRLVWRRRRYLAFSGVMLFAHLRHRPSLVRRLPGVFVLLALAAIAAALMDPVVPHSEAQIQSQGLDIILVVDLSSSMQEVMDEARPANSMAKLTFSNKDAQPHRLAGRTRLDTVKTAVRRFVSVRRDDRLGLVVFSDNAYVVSPLTFDHDYLQAYIDMVDDQILRGEGMTAIGDGITLADVILARQSAADSRNKVVIVFTDGEYNFGRDPIDALRDSKDAGVRVHVVGVDIEKEVRSKPAVQKLIQTVRQNGGRYYNADTSAQLASASADLDRIEKGLLTHRMYVRNLPVFHWFAIPAILLLLAALALRAAPFFADFT